MSLKSEIPLNHIAIIMDGNGRWAKSRNLPVEFGHQKGSEAIRELIKSAIEFKIKYLTIFAFSTENWNRPKKEVDNLMDLMRSYLKKEAKNFIANDVKIVMSGSLEKLTPLLRNEITELQEATKNNKTIILNVAFDYGGRAEIVDAFKKIISNINSKSELLDLLNEDLISNNLYNPELPNPDLIIRTAGEKRLSNFLLWQSVYSEFYFTDTLWPDFGKEDLSLAISEFKNRQRRYGKR